ncbi:MAG: ribonuclease III [Reyranellaceae bacterium]
MARRHPLQPILHGHPLRPAEPDLARLAATLGHDFRRRELAIEALTHRGALDRRPDLKAAFPYGNERLEFLGDRVLSLAVAQILLDRFPTEREGPMARRHAALVSARTLAEVAGQIDLSSHAITYAGAPPPTATVQSDMLEALLGAVFLDAGFEVAAAVVGRLWGDRLSRQDAAPQPPKMQLQEWAQSRRLALPAYREVGREGSEHEPVFLVEVTVGDHPPASGRGTTKRDAESAAAAALLAILGRKR